MSRQTFDFSGPTPLKSVAQFHKEAEGLARADDLLGLIGLCDYLIAHWGAYPQGQYEGMLAHLGTIAQTRRRRIDRIWQLGLN